MSDKEKNKHLIDEYFKSRFSQASVEPDRRLWDIIFNNLHLQNKQSNRYGIYGLLSFFILLIISGVGYLYYNSVNHLDNDGSESVSAVKNEILSELNKNDNGLLPENYKSYENFNFDSKSLDIDLKNRFLNSEKNNIKLKENNVKTKINENDLGNDLSLFDEFKPDEYNLIELLKYKSLIFNYQFPLSLKLTNVPDRKEIDEYIESSGYYKTNSWSFELSGGPVFIKPLTKWHVHSTLTEQQDIIKALIGYEGGFFSRKYLNEKWFVQTGFKLISFKTENILGYKSLVNDTAYIAKEYDSLIFYSKLSLARFEKAWREEQIISSHYNLNSQMSSQNLLTLSLPLMFGYTMRLGNFSGSVESGIVYSRLVKAEADILNEDSSAVLTFDLKDEEFPYRKNNYGLLTRLSLNYHIYKSWAVTINPYAYFNINESVNSSPFREYSGVSIGLNYYY